MAHLHDELLKRFALRQAEGARPCSCGRPHALGVREILLGVGALEEAAARLSRGAAICWIWMARSTSFPIISYSCLTRSFNAR